MKRLIQAVCLAVCVVIALGSFSAASARRGADDFFEGGHRSGDHRGGGHHHGGGHD